MINFKENSITKEGLKGEVPKALLESAFKSAKSLILGNFIKAEAQESGVNTYVISTESVLKTKENSRREAGWSILSGLIKFAPEA